MIKPLLLKNTKIIQAFQTLLGKLLTYQRPQQSQYIKWKGVKYKKAAGPIKILQKTGKHLLKWSTSIEHIITHDLIKCLLPEDTKTASIRLIFENKWAWKDCKLQTFCHIFWPFAKLLFQNLRKISPRIIFHIEKIIN